MNKKKTHVRKFRAIRRKNTLNSILSPIQQFVECENAKHISKRAIRVGAARNKYAQ